MFDFDQPHLRTNILTGEKVLVSPHRSARPWQGQVEAGQTETRPTYDSQCYLCPTNTRANVTQYPDYKNGFVFTNDFSALLPNPNAEGTFDNDLLQAETERGICKVIAFSPRHDLTLPEMEETDIAAIVDLWQEEFMMLKQTPWIHYIQIFENKGSIMGCSNPHPHGQIWAQQSIPVEIKKEGKQQLAHYQRTGRSLLQDYIAAEEKEQSRIIINNEHFLVVVPFWAIWPYETLVLSKRHCQHIGQFTDIEKLSLAHTLKELTTRYDNIFKTSFPYSAGMHQSPVNTEEMPEWHWHMHFYPPLLRSASVKKFMVGYEMLASPQRDITPEYAAKILQEQSTTHYKKS